MLEMRSVALAAPYPQALLDELGEFLHGMDVAVKADDSEAYIDYALRFHRRLVQSSGNRTFLGVWDSLLWDIRGRIALRRLADQGKSLKALVSMHRALLGRLRAQDVEGATERLKAPLERVCSAFAEPTTAR